MQQSAAAAEERLELGDDVVVVLLTKAHNAAVRAAVLAAGVPVRLAGGTAQSDPWTMLSVGDPAQAPGLARHLVDALQSSVLLVVLDDGATSAEDADTVQDLAIVRPTVGLLTATRNAPEAFASALAEAFDTSVDAAALTARLADDGRPGAGGRMTACWPALVTALGVPAWLVRPGPEHAVVLTRQRDDNLRLAAAIAGPAWLVPLEEGWTGVLQAQQRPTSAFGLAGGVSANEKRRSATILLWADEQVCGYLLLRRGSPLDVHLWNDPWEGLAPDPADAEAVPGDVGDAAVLAAAFDCRDNEVFLRALLRRRGEPRALLGELVELLGLPAASMGLLESGNSPPQHLGVSYVERRSMWGAVRDAGRRDAARPVPAPLRTPYRVYAWATAVAAVVSALMVVVCGWEVASDASVGEPGDRFQDVLWALGFVVLTTTLGLSARGRLRRCRSWADGR